MASVDYAIDHYCLQEAEDFFNSQQLEEVLEKIFECLYMYNPYIYHVSKNNSTYIKFRENGIGSIRIANHTGRHKYKYKWNLRSDILDIYNQIDRGVTRYYYPLKKYKEMINKIKGEVNE